jgi:tripartite motif-containing protein 71
MPLDVFRDVVVGCEYADGEWASGVLERKRASGGCLYLREYKKGRRYDLGQDVGDAWRMAFHGEGSSQRMAVFDISQEATDSRLSIYNVESGQRVATAGSGGNDAQLLQASLGMAFSPTGELYVSDYGRSRILVFDREGRYARRFGEDEDGECYFGCPEGLCFTADGDLVMVDYRSHRVQVFREDGTFVRAFGSEGRGEGEFLFPRDVCVLPDGSMAVLDSSNHRVQVFDGMGVFVRSFGSEGEGPGQFSNPDFVRVGACGEIIVADYRRKDLQVFSKEGELLQIIGKGGDSDVDLNGIRGVATDASGRLFVLDGNSVVMLC